MPAQDQSRRAPSLRRQLLFWLLFPLIGLLALNSVMTYNTALSAANAAYDRTLLGSARAIADGVTVANAELQVNLPYVALEMFESNVHDRIFYRVGLADGRFLTGYADLPAPQGRAAAADKPLFYETKYQDERIRVVALFKPLYDPKFDQPVLIQVAETLESRRALIREFLLDAALRQVGLIAVAALLVWLGVQWGFRPLLRLREEIKRRSQTDLTPIGEEKIHREVRPLVQAINIHMARLDSLISAQQRFIADASHQMRTPLTLLNTQAEFALRQGDPEVMRNVVQDLHKNTQQTVRLANQLLMLARAEPDSGIAKDFGVVELVALARGACLEWTPAALKKQIDLGFEGPEQDACVTGNSVLLHELVANLVDNAIRYIQADGIVTVRVRNESAAVVLEVEDNGPGIPPAERERVFERFYRVLGTTADGSGLGLAIVRELCRSHRAAIALQEGAGGKGLLVSVRFSGLSVAGAQ